MPQKHQDLSISDFINQPVYRFGCLGASILTLVVMILIPLPKFVPAAGIIKSAEKLSDSWNSGWSSRSSSRPGRRRSLGRRRLKYWVVVRYTVENREYEIKKILHTEKLLYNSTPVQVFYDSGNPGDGHLRVPMFSIHLLLLLILFLLGALTGFLFWWNRFHKQLKEKQRQLDEEAKKKVLVPTPVPGKPSLAQILCLRCDRPTQYPIHLAGSNIRCMACNYRMTLPAVAMQQSNAMQQTNPIQQSGPMPQVNPIPQSNPMPQSNPVTTFPQPPTDPENKGFHPPGTPGGQTNSNLTEREKRIDDLLNE